MDQIQKVVLSTPENACYNFRVGIEMEDGTARTFTISGAESATRVYRLTESSHDAYLDLFYHIASDFGLRLPKNKELNDKPKYTEQINYNPILTTNLDQDMLYGYGDPAILKSTVNEETWYYLVATSNDAEHSFPLIKSQDLKDWTFCNYIFPKGKKPKWAAEGEFVSDYWAPEMHKVGKEYRTYFVARHRTSKELCIGMVHSESPEGEYTAEKQPILSGNVIDPHVFVQDEKNVFLLWKEDNNDIWPQKLTELLFHSPRLITKLFTQEKDWATAAFIITLWDWAKNLSAMERFFVLQVLIEAVTEQYSHFEQRLALLTQEEEFIAQDILEVLRYMKTPMFIQQLSDDGTTLIGERSKIMENDLPWEAHLVEGMWLTHYENKYYLFYAGNDFSTEQYGIGVAVADSIRGPYHKADENLLKSTKEWLAPGHPSVLKTENGDYFMFLHAYFPGEAGYKKFRALLQIPLIFDNGKVRVS